MYSEFTDAHLNDPADFWGTKANKMFILTQVANHDALHYGVTLWKDADPDIPILIAAKCEYAKLQ